VSDMRYYGNVRKWDITHLVEKPWIYRIQVYLYSDLRKKCAVFERSRSADMCLCEADVITESFIYLYLILGMLL
jgi:hypothetical protein